VYLPNDPTRFLAEMLHIAKLNELNVFVHHA